MPAAPGTSTEATAPPEHGPFREAFELALELGEDYLQRVTFDIPGADPLVLDEPPPLGGDGGPSPARVLGAAVGGCLGASLAFCLRKSHVNVRRIRTTVRGELVRNERGRVRVGRILVTLKPEVSADQIDRVPRCVDLFEDYCVVTASIRSAVPVEVSVVPVAV